MKKLPLKQTGLVLLGMFVLINLFFWITPKLHPDRMPGIGKWRVLSVLTGSMSPSIDSGDMVIVAQYDSSVPAKGDIVTFWQDQAKQSLITHRVVQRLQNGFIQTKGDANQEEDGGWTPPASIVGKVVATVPYAATIQKAMQHPLGYLFMLSIPGLMMYRDKKRQAHQSANKTSPIKEETV